ncbi:MAG: VOC family protein [Gemmatimonadales bacterium]|nr:VOC family protein [Gemmatimonadales bacterium]
MTSNPVGWFEIYVQDMTRAQRFYEAMLGVKLDSLPLPESDGPPVEMLAFPMEMDRAGAAGALVKMDGYRSGGNSTLVYFSCDDVAVEAGRVVSAGGRVEREKMSIGQYGFIALAFDTEGNMFGLHSTK